MKRSPMPPRKKPMKRYAFKKGSALREVSLLRHSLSQKYKRMGPVKPMKLRSKKKKQQDREYSRLRKEFLSENPKCQVVGCKLPSCQVHHRARRGKFYLRVDTWMAACFQHHEKIEREGEWAKANGYTLTIEQRRLLP